MRPRIAEPRRDRGTDRLTTRTRGGIMKTTLITLGVICLLAPGVATAKCVGSSSRVRS